MPQINICFHISSNTHWWSNGISCDCAWLSLVNSQCQLSKAGQDKGAAVWMEGWDFDSWTINLAPFFLFGIFRGLPQGGRTRCFRREFGNESVAFSNNLI